MDGSSLLGVHPFPPAQWFTSVSSYRSSSAVGCTRTLSTDVAARKAKMGVPLRSVRKTTIPRSGRSGSHRPVRPAS